MAFPEKKKKFPHQAKKDGLKKSIPQKCCLKSKG